jgi:hypothetical protein
MLTTLAAMRKRPFWAKCFVVSATCHVAKCKNLPTLFHLNFSELLDREQFYTVWQNGRLTKWHGIHTEDLALFWIILQIVFYSKKCLRVANKWESVLIAWKLFKVVVLVLGYFVNQPFL